MGVSREEGFVLTHLYNILKFPQKKLVISEFIFTFVFMEFKCTKCDTVLLDRNIWYHNGCNSEGEDYGIVEALCPNCGMGWEESQWMNFEDLEEAKEYLIFKNENNNT